MTGFLVAVMVMDMLKMCQYEYPLGTYYLSVEVQEVCPVTVHIDNE